MRPTDEVADDAGEPDARILGPQFARLALLAGVYFVAMGATFPVMPRFLRDELGATDTVVGLVLGSMAVGAILGRPVVGHMGDRRGRAVLMVAGGIVSALSMLGLLLSDATVVVLILRILLGAGQGATMVGATTMAIDLAPGHRSGEATSYIFVALHLGTGLGSLLGEWVLRTWSFDAVWTVSAALMAATSLIALTLPNVVGDDHAVHVDGSRNRLMHPQAIVPGAILGVGILGFIGFNAFVPLYADEIGVGDVAPYFLATSLTIVLIRGVGARLPDRLGPRLGGTIALVGVTAGLLVIGGWRTAAGLAVGSVVLAAGTAMLLPSLVGAAVAGVPATQRSFALATYTLFLEISNAFGAVLFGGVAAVSDYGTAYLVSAGLAVVSLVMLRTLIPARTTA